MAFAWGHTPYAGYHDAEGAEISKAAEGIGSAIMIRNSFHAFSTK